MTKILFLSNSFGDDTIEYMPKILEDFGVDIDLFNLYIGGCDITKHINNLENNLKAYELRIYNKEKEVWETRYDVSANEFIASTTWDYLILQQSSYMSGLPNGLDGIDKLVKLVRDNLVDKNTKLLWNMTWAYPKYSKLEVFTDFFKSNQEEMYRSIVNNVKKYIVGNVDFYKIIPNGTSIMNARKYVEDELLHRDDFHLSFNHGRYLAGLTASRIIFDIDLSKINYRPDFLKKEEQDIFVKSVLESVKYPFEVRK